MKGKVNTFFAILLVAIAGLVATWFIYHLAYENNLAQTVNGNEANFSDLQQSILKN
jgi:hypothetical protein